MAKATDADDVGTTQPFAAHAVYFVLTDRFVNGDPSNDQREQGGPDPALRTFDRPMGLAIRDGRMALGGRGEVWEFRNPPAIAPLVEPAGRGLGIGGPFSDRPTVPYPPIKGEDFVRVMLTPIPPGGLIAMLAAGTPADAVLGLAVQSINGRRNWTAEAQAQGRFDRAFSTVATLRPASLSASLEKRETRT